MIIIFPFLMVFFLECEGGISLVSLIACWFTILSAVVVLWYLRDIGWLFFYVWINVLFLSLLVTVCWFFYINN